MMYVGSLFSGIGGIELGFEREGFFTKWFVENNDYCQAILSQHFYMAKIYGNITNLDFSKLEPVQILTGGFPCQDISIAGAGKGIIEGKRSSLWNYFAKAIGQIRPEVAVIENVPALTFRGLDRVLADLAEEGYDAEWFDLRASDFGALHKRERIFVIAYTDQFRRRCKIQFEEKNTAENEGRINCEESEKAQRIFITDDWSERIQRFREESLSGKQGFSRFENVRRVKELFGRSNISEPLVCRGSNGIPDRVDRTKALGNAVIPQVAQFIARRIREVIT